ncbi:MAG TPA: hypothetical protein VN704_08560, partial [Verrucomicrobiae bacterium]|nr:hypothetical protein [Verrucomicrobiae bacterium]
MSKSIKMSAIGSRVKPILNSGETFSGSYFFALANLGIEITLGNISPTNPLNFPDAIETNWADPFEQIRSSLRRTANSLVPNSIPFIKTANDDLRTREVSDAFLCWMITYNSEMLDLMNCLAEDMKFAFTNDSDMSDTDPKTNHKYALFLEFVRLTTKKYFIRTREGALLDKFLPKLPTEKNLLESYKRFRKYYFDLIYTPLYSQTYRTLFQNGTDGWVDVSNSLQQNLLNAFQNLSTNTTYGEFLNSMNDIITATHDFLLSTGVLGQFLVNQYGILPEFAGKNICGFEDKLQTLLNRLQSISGDAGTFINSYFIQEINGNIVTAYDNRPIMNFITNKKPSSILESICYILIQFIFHLIDKFILYGFGSASVPSDYITQEGSLALQGLFGYIASSTYSNTTGTIFSLFSGEHTFMDSDIEFILGDTVIQSGSPNNFIQFGLLKYIISQLQVLLSSSNDITLYDIRQDNLTPLT